MTAAEPLPRRTTNDRFPHEMPPDAAPGFQGYAPIEWLRKTNISLSDAQKEWADGKLVEVPAGRAWDVVRLPLIEGWETVRHLRNLHLSSGPIMATYDSVEVLVAVGAPDGWDLPETRVLTSGDTIELPPPIVVAPHTCRAKTWIVAPRDLGHLINAADLYSAYAAAMTSVRSTRRYIR